MSTKLNVVTEGFAETPAQRLTRLEAEAEAAERDLVEQWLDSLNQLLLLGTAVEGCRRLQGVAALALQLRPCLGKAENSGRAILGRR